MCNKKGQTIAKASLPSEDCGRTELQETMTMTDDSKKLSRKQHKQAVKEQKKLRRAKRMGEASPDVGRKPCDLCQTPVDMLIRCTVDETQKYRMVCGKCWPSVSGGVPDGTADYPHYNYGGLWKNRSANLKKKVGSGGGVGSATASAPPH